MPKRRGFGLKAHLAVAIAVAAGLSVVPNALGIHGGIPQDPNPAWAVRLDRPGFWCSGALIRPRWVITAAHCVDAVASDPSGASASVAGQRIGVDAVRVYPGWSNPYPDIALVHLASDVTGGATLPLATSNDARYFEDRTVTVFGYGRLTLDNTGPGTVVAVKSPDGAWKRARQCPSLLRGPGTYDCYQFVGQQNRGLIRSGDSGGPWVGWRNGGWRILGVVSGYISAKGVAGT